MKHTKQIALGAVVSFILWFTQSNFCYAQNPDTRKGYNLKGYGYDSAVRFIVRYYPQMQSIIGVVSDDAELIDGIKKIIKDLDKEGYENITLLLHDENDYGENRTKHKDAITFYRIGDPIASIRKGDDFWYIFFIKLGKTEGIKLEKGEEKYPYLLIKMMTKRIFKD